MEDDANLGECPRAPLPTRASDANDSNRLRRSPTATPEYDASTAGRSPQYTVFYRVGKEYVEIHS